MADVPNNQNTPNSQPPAALDIPIKWLIIVAVLSGGSGSALLPQVFPQLYRNDPCLGVTCREIQQKQDEILSRIRTLEGIHDGKKK